MTLALSILLFLAIAGVAAQHLWIARFRRELRDRKHQQEAAIALIDQIGATLTTQQEADSALNATADFIVEAVKAESGAIYLFDESRQQLRARVIKGLFPPMQAEVPEYLCHMVTRIKKLDALLKRAPTLAELEANPLASFILEKLKSEAIAVGDGIIGVTARDGEPVLVTDAKNDSRVPKALSERLGITTLMAAPLRTRGVNLGVLAVVNRVNGKPFVANDLELLKAIADQAAIAVDMFALVKDVADKERIKADLKMAHDFQQMFLPKSCPQLEGFDIAAFSTPALEVGGDYYDFIQLGEDRVGIVIADVSGKGMSGALIMAMVRSVLWAEARGGDSPRDVLRRVNERSLEDTKDSVFITMTYGILDARDRTFRFARAGHEPLLTGRAGQRSIQQLKPEGIALGLVESEVFDVLEEGEIQFSQGDMALLYTDGAVEILDPQGNEYGQDRLCASLLKRMNKTSRDAIDGLMEDIGRFRSTANQRDDITMVAIRAFRKNESVRETGSPAGLAEVLPDPEMAHRPV